MSQPKAPDCPEGHAWESRIRGGHPLHVRVCQLCRAIDWDDLSEQLRDMPRVVGAAVVRPGDTLVVAVSDDVPDPDEFAELTEGLTIALDGVRVVVAVGATGLAVQPAAT